MPTHFIFVTSAFFHYLGPAFAVILFGYVPVLGVAWLRIATAAAAYATWRKPWRAVLPSLSRNDFAALVALGATFAAMNSCFYLAISKIPLATVGAIEFLAPVGLAASGVRNGRNLLALFLAGSGAYLLSEIQLPHQPLALAFALAQLRPVCLLHSSGASVRPGRLFEGNRQNRVFHASRSRLHNSLRSRRCFRLVLQADSLGSRSGIGRVLLSNPICAGSDCHV